MVFYINQTESSKRINLNKIKVCKRKVLQGIYFKNCKLREKVKFLFLHLEVAHTKF